MVSPVVLDLNAVIGKAMNMLKRLIGEDIEFKVVQTDALWAIEADEDQVFQVLLNLCLNARDAMPGGGTLSIATENVYLREEAVATEPYLKPGDYVRFSVTDTGIGISKAIQQEIFEPFFTTKEVGKGTGLGLATVYGIVQQSGGHVTVESEPGKGACFAVYLPRATLAASSSAAVKADAPRGGGETVLVAEDEEFLRKGVSEFLASLGYRVLVAASGEEALEVASQQERIDLLLTDMVMPRMNGRDLSRILKKLRPGLKVIYMSGYTSELRRGVDDLHAAFLQKPFGLGTLARRVSDSLTERWQ